ncbi:MAG: sensor domain-containing diguanylate cyclase [Acinetobacter sp.]|nr:sensor domain-containing diguanylate cyclase [Acinetobacter sp.]MDN5555467.1 sensor domain-containing diguanylate cyclase [Acinetobacter sp.]
MSKADSLQAVLDTIAYWISHVFDADRASITLQDTEEYLKLYSISGNHAIPMDFKIPIGQTFVGRVFACAKLIICDDLSQSDELDCRMLSEHGMGTCMDAPMIHNGVCIGTLNVADQRKHHYTLQQAILLQSLATWLALNIKLHLQVQEMAVLASTDELTGTFNRREFVQESNQTMQHFSHARVPFTIGILDIDHFKQLNDCYGHTAGDHVLKKMTKKMKGILREGDFLARIGGEEFAIILPACLGDEAMRVFKRICSTIEAMEVHYEQEVLCFTVSIGVAEVGKHDADAEDVFKRADKALYCAKQAGRNRIHFAN